MLVAVVTEKYGENKFLLSIINYMTNNILFLFSFSCFFLFIKEAEIKENSIFFFSFFNLWQLFKGRILWDFHIYSLKFYRHFDSLKKGHLHLTHIMTF